MTTTSQIKERLVEESDALRQRVAELEELEAKHNLEKEALKESAEKLKTIVENTHDVIFQLSPLGMIQYVSPKVKETYGYEPEELVGKHLAITTPASELLRALAVLKSVLSGETISNFEINQLDANGKVVPMEINSAPVRKDGKIIAVQGIMRDITERKRAEEEAKRSTEKLLETMENTIKAMAMIVEMRDPHTAGHQRLVTQLACAIAKKMGLSEDQISTLHLAGLIHDIGKVRVPTEILTNPNGLSEAEFNMIKTHPLVGYEILKTMEFQWPIAQIVHQHHERMDGSGYPSGLSGEDIIPEARIMAVADVVEAIASHRPYRPALGIDRALGEISQKRGTLYDPIVVDTCLMLFRENRFKFE